MTIEIFSRQTYLNNCSGIERVAHSILNDAIFFMKHKNKKIFFVYLEFQQFINVKYFHMLLWK